MMSEQPKSLEGARSEYAAPKLMTISLRPEEAVLGACKSSSISGSASLSPCVVLFCHSIGS